MTASPVTTHLVRSGSYSLAVDPETGLPRIGSPLDDIHVHRMRLGARVHWRITRMGRVLAVGTAWTWAGAMVKATAAAHRPGGWRGAR